MSESSFILTDESGNALTTESGMLLVGSEPETGYWNNSICEFAVFNTDLSDSLCQSITSLT